MAFAKFLSEDKRYVLILTDGFVRRMEEENTDALAVAREEGMTKHLYRLVKRQHYPKETGRTIRGIPEPTHIWIVGYDGWTTDIPQVLEDVTEGEARSDYRIVITGIGLPSSEEGYYLNFESWLPCIGMHRKKKHASTTRFKSASKRLLEEMCESYRECGRPACKILEEHSIPYFFFGD